MTSSEKGTKSIEGKSCDILAMATHGRGGVERWVMGCVTERVLEAITVPMLVVRSPQTVLHTEEMFETHTV